MQMDGTVRAEIAGHGQFETRATSLDEMINRHWNTPFGELVAEIKEAMGDPNYDASGMSKIEIMLVLCELNGLATN